MPIRPGRWGEAQIKLNQTKYPLHTLHCYWTGLFADELCAMSPRVRQRAAGDTRGQGTESTEIVPRIECWSFTFHSPVYCIEFTSHTQIDFKHRRFRLSCLSCMPILSITLNTKYCWPVTLWHLASCSSLFESHHPCYNIFGWMDGWKWIFGDLKQCSISDGFLELWKAEMRKYGKWRHSLWSVKAGLLNVLHSVWPVTSRPRNERDFTITETTPTKAFSGLKAPIRDLQHL